VHAYAHVHKTPSHKHDLLIQYLWAMKNSLGLQHPTRHTLPWHTTHLCAAVSVHLASTPTFSRFVATLLSRQIREKYLVFLTIQIVSFITKNGYVTARGPVVSRYESASRQWVKLSKISQLDKQGYTSTSTPTLSRVSSPVCRGENSPKPVSFASACQWRTSNPPKDCHFL